ncbi:hypothetical protein [Streptomyces shenzhenensis]|uniref:TIR domain-containing protein n=1 Tax=Streptomyces shenzhenensis TaxID=943815 RepID=A0A3M0HXB0_9ACTN|nr:hypothetical protein [Streptomyces shenzhenensis]RMB80690.1 hypothetical protein CTZ28_39015 [Streptomyces shenzhenensis]
MTHSDTGPVRVFLGAPSILTPGQQTTLERWVGWLERQPFQVVRLGRDGHGDDPWHTLSRLLTQVDGIVLLGFRQLHAPDAVWRPDTGEESRSARWWTSPWLQLEAGMAVALSLPVLVAPEDDVAEGVFQPETWNGQVRGTRLSTPGTGTGDWCDAVRAHREHRA